MIGLNVGSGQRRFTSNPHMAGCASHSGIAALCSCGAVEWVNVDKISRPGHEPDLVCDGAHLPYADASVDYFVLHHVLEHFGCGEAAGLIKEAYRVLRPRGSLIVCVPDLCELSLGWNHGKIDTQIYVTNLYGAYMGNEEDRHRWGYDHNSLLTFLVSCLRPEPTWREAKEFNFRPIPGADIARDWWILGMEAIK